MAGRLWRRLVSTRLMCTRMVRSIKPANRQKLDMDHWRTVIEFKISKYKED